MQAIKSKKLYLSKDDLLLWDELKKGSSSALGCLYELYIDELFSFGIQYSKDRAFVMDCIHDLFFDLYKYKSKLAETDNVKSYLFRSLRRKINKKYTRKIIPVQAENQLKMYDLQKNHVASFEDDIIRSETVDEINSKLKIALETLTNKQKKGLFLRFTQDKTYEEIADIMKTSIPTARTTIYRALKILRRQPFLLYLLLYPSFFS
ncbi:RNA polymerase sigma factor [Euzebyella saccharophila]|uniref:RNA polymerase sigma factor n=1 Tax=Euzebyella saccharophila TaxID=679664 RepID=A0ABV8JM77_9FLAO|nr:sigma-70 family RNA polymerase sigma factor [Euzebyella saccharophila]